jgi:hypothetical protein
MYANAIAVLLAAEFLVQLIHEEFTARQEHFVRVLQSEEISRLKRPIVSSVSSMDKFPVGRVILPKRYFVVDNNNDRTVHRRH